MASRTAPGTAPGTALGTGVGTAQRGRRSARVSGDDRQDAILATAERLLADRRLDDISIEDLASGAGISRPSFYFYFGSKDDVLLALLDRVIAEVQARVAELPRSFEEAPAASWRRALGVFVDVFAAHRAVSAAAITARLRNSEIHDLWSASMETWVSYAAETIAAERSRGAAPDGIDAHDLAVALNLMNERVLSAAFSGESPAIDHQRALDVLTGVWVRSIYAADLETNPEASHNEEPHAPVATREEPHHDHPHHR
ncbi:TetR/AcrR family transcriptional regulator [Subtercola endophyticus]|uniref:TetR/AcrR family transcriptional regulator n=1 Tax=Subtercola endophyticus TaxID=2895559 RepID=UPI001E620656|nr:TetR/AcrR family transcriptional regulator [Subtercola endophyticus]UFS59224.1 TetR/AcrR family transcriptional regulator [Subtercola endophyticus]